jgi:hypothetical protein
MAFHNRIKETTTTTGTGDYSLGGAQVGYNSFATWTSDGESIYYTCSDDVHWEVGLGTFHSSGNTITRTTILSTSNNDTSPISWSSGNKSIWADVPAQYLNTVATTGKAIAMAIVFGG